MTILVDMDDTIEQLLAAWIDKLNAMYGYAVTPEDSTDWDVSKAFPGLTREQVYDVPRHNDFWKDVEPVPGAAEVMQRWIADGHDVYIVTASQYESIPGKMRDLLFRCFPFIAWDHVIITSHKQMLRADVLIDDGVHNLEGGDYAKILVDAPYNRHYDAASGGMKRVYNWDEIEREVARINAERNEA